MLHCYPQLYGVWNPYIIEKVWDISRMYFEGSLAPETVKNV